ncbi:MAG: acyl-CoA dehydrogenase [Firmicutes bacterium]|nr:acyl-CoA dehydrogenase [Bacillota bacterium]
MSEQDYVKGGSFLLSQLGPDDVFTPEELDDMHLMIKKTCDDFGENKVFPLTDEIEAKAEGVTVGLLKEAGELGLLGSDIPEEYGGDGGDKTTSALIAEALTYSGSFSTAFGAHTGIGTLPIVYFGTKEQKERYLPDLAVGNKIAAYALTEPEAGSDAMNARSTAVLTEDGKHYILNGTKMFITNAAWADVIIVFAKIDGEKFTAFIVDRDSEGLSISPEEKKMGIHGSSTCSVIMEDCKVPVENVLHVIGKGHQVALNILNIGRFKLAAGAVGGAKKAIEASIEYALERHQFNQPIAQFNLIKNKIADMLIKTYAMESMVYRTVGLIDTKMEDVDMDAEDANQQVVNSIREYAIECSINKVYCSEGLDQIVDEAVQIYGGYGYSAEYIVERLYRDSRINRIFEGTNEVNRMLIPGTLLPKAMSGDLPFMDAVFGLKGELDKLKEMEVPTESPEKEAFVIENMKKLFLLACGNAARQFEQAIEQEQEILVALANIAMEVFAAESSLLRARKIAAESGEEAARLPMLMTQCLVSEMVPKCQAWTNEVIAGTFEPEKAARNTDNILLLSRNIPLNTYVIKRELADEAYKAKKYFLEK